MGSFKDLIIQDIKEITGVDTSNLIDSGLLQLNEARKWVVKQKYYALAQTGRTFTDVKYDLSIIYGMSVSSIEKMIYRK